MTYDLRVTYWKFAAGRPPSFHSLLPVSDVKHSYTFLLHFKILPYLIRNSPLFLTEVKDQEEEEDDDERIFIIIIIIALRGVDDKKVERMKHRQATTMQLTISGTKIDEPLH